MHRTHLIPRTSSHRWSLATALLVGLGSLVPTPSAPSADAAATATDVFDVAASAPHRMQGGVADVIVAVRGAEICSGTPITGTRFVVTAAHCVLSQDGEVVPTVVLRAGSEFVAVSVLVDTRYHDDPVPMFDAAVLVLDQSVPGPSASLGTLPRDGNVTLVGFQALDSDGSLLRGTNPHNRPLPEGVTGGVITIDRAPAGCVQRVADLGVADDSVRIDCGLIPGASGGGLFAERDGAFVLTGITSTVSADLTSNRIVPMASLERLLENPVAYAHEPQAPESGTTRSNIVPS